MTAFLARRLGQLLLTMVAASMLLFLLTEASPGNVASKILGPYALPSQVEILYQRLGLDDPLPERYVRWAGTLLGLVDNPLSDPAIRLGLEDPRGSRYFGNLGFSLMLKQPVVDALAERLGYTALLAAIALAAIVPLSLAIGLVSGVMAGRAVDRGLSILMIVLTSIPEFVCAVALLLLFTVIWRVLPGTSTMTAGDRWSMPAQLVMPVAVLTIASATYVARIVRASVVDTVRMPFVRTARLKGLSSGRVVLHHILPNAMIAPLTVILLQVQWLLTGVVVVESIFAYPGVGALMLQAALFGDLFLIQALTLLALFVATGTQLLGDLCYVALDPKIRVS